MFQFVFREDAMDEEEEEDKNGEEVEERKELGREREVEGEKRT